VLRGARHIAGSEVTIALIGQEPDDAPQGSDILCELANAVAQVGINAVGGVIFGEPTLMRRCLCLDTLDTDAVHYDVDDVFEDLVLSGSLVKSSRR
jgi:hypothetical protein